MRERAELQDIFQALRSPQPLAHIGPSIGSTDFFRLYQIRTDIDRIYSAPREEVVTGKELRSRIWADENFGDFRPGYEDLVLEAYLKA
jgi:hypothetical protein